MYIPLHKRISITNMNIYKIPYERSRSRRHYTSRGKCKETYETENEANKYISKHKLYGMRAYFCNVCNKYHIGHYESSKEK